MRPTAPRQAQGAALLSALLVVTLVATLAATALWRQWRLVEVESAERTRQQAAWLLVGAQDWARLILREDVRTNQVDHLSEPWAVPLREARLTTFLAANQQSGDGIFEAMLSGEITDLQGRMNARALAEDGSAGDMALLAWRRLFTLLRLPLFELENLRTQLRAQNPQDKPPTRLYAWPERVDDLQLFGVSASTLSKLRPYIAVLPQNTTVNVNTATPEVLFASVGGIDYALAQRIVQQRSSTYFNSLTDLRQMFPAAASSLDDNRLGVSSRYFEIRGRLRMGDLIIEEHALVERLNQEVRTLQRWRTAPER